MNLDELRKQIDEIDNKISEAYIERLKIVKQVADYKKENGVSLNHPNREGDILSRITRGKDADYAEELQYLYGKIFEKSKVNQAKRGEFGLPYNVVEGVSENPLVICQGNEGAYSHIFALKYFDKPQISFCENFKDVCEAVEKGSVKYGVLPLENSTAGSVEETYALLKKYNLYITASEKISVGHCLLGLPEAELSSIKEVVSHPQALAQCSNFIEEYKFLQTNAKNTAIACEKFITDRSKSAIASPLCAELYGLKILAENIQNTALNYTRFIILTKEPAFSATAGTLGFIFTLKNEKNSLCKLLGLFSACDIDIKKIESKNIPNTDFEVNFYLMAEGKLADENIKSLFCNLENYCRDYKFLGNW